MQMVNALHLYPDRDSEQLLRKEFAELYQHPFNIRRHIIPHLAISLACLPKNLHEQYLNRLEIFTETLSTIDVVTSHVYAGDASYILLNVDSPQLRELHNSYLDSFSDLLAGHYNKKYLQYDLDEKLTKYLEKYGYHRVKENYLPHITLAKFTDPEVQKKALANTTKAITLKLNFNRIVFDEVGANQDTDVNTARILWEKDLH